MQRVDSEFSASDFLSSILTGHATKLITHIGELRDEKSAEAVHDTRVAIRTINSHLSTFSPFLRRKPTADLQQQLNWLNSKIADVRNFDVMISM